MSLSLALLLFAFSLDFQELVVCQSVHRTRPYTGPPVIPVILPGGFIAETQEVASARDAHLRLFAQTAVAARESHPEEVQQKYTGVSGQHQQVYSQQTQQRFTGPVRGQVIFEDSQTNKQYSGFSQDGGFRQHEQQPSGPLYRGPPVVPVILPNGHIAETADVEAARRNHLRLVSEAQKKAQQRVAEPAGEYNHKPQRQPWKGPAATTVLLPSGHLADTPEVADAKVFHLQQLLAAAQKSRQQLNNLN